MAKIEFDDSWRTVLNVTCGIPTDDENGESYANTRVLPQIIPWGSDNPLHNKIEFLTKPLTLENIIEVIHMENGEGDSSDWWGVFKVKGIQGEYGNLYQKQECYLYVTAGCDYSGWG